ncbi:hypothetical protein D6C79_09373 [Aureobasidium pullulans]|nr:hypothetical protein D6C79_09373 [Aureobasidium pullulans]
MFRADLEMHILNLVGLLSIDSTKLEIADQICRLCFERFNALNASLLAFEPLVEKFLDEDPMAVLMKSTWHMVMIKLLHWSHTHTNGVVEASLNAAFAAATHLSMSQEISPSVEAIASLESHINYFLRLLRQEHAVYDEAP